MSSFGQKSEAIQQDMILRDGFLRWQCRVRQIAMRENMGGRPDDAITPAVTPVGNTAPVGRVITLLSKKSAYSKTPEMQHIFKQTHDPAQRRNMAIQLFAETYYQKAREFSDTLSATFPPESPGAQAILTAAHCSLAFDAYGQQFSLKCKVSKLAKDDPLYQATWWHNLLFNPNLQAETIILGFEPDWVNSSANPDVAGAARQGERMVQT